MEKCFKCCNLKSSWKIVVVKSVKSEDIQSGAQNEDIAVFKRWLNFLDLTHEEQINYASQEDKN